MSKIKSKLVVEDDKTQEKGETENWCCDICEDGTFQDISAYQAIHGIIQNLVGYCKV